MISFLVLLISKSIIYLIQQAFDHDHDFQYNSQHWSHLDIPVFDSQLQILIDPYQLYHKAVDHVMPNKNYRANLKATEICYIYEINSIKIQYDITSIHWAI